MKRKRAKRRNPAIARGIPEAFAARVARLS